MADQSNHYGSLPSFLSEEEASAKLALRDVLDQWAKRKEISAESKAYAYATTSDEGKNDTQSGWYYRAAVLSSIAKPSNEKDTLETLYAINQNQQLTETQKLESLGKFIDTELKKSIDNFFTNPNNETPSNRSSVSSSYGSIPSARSSDTYTSSMYTAPPASPYAPGPVKAQESDHSAQSIYSDLRLSNPDTQITVKQTSSEDAEALMTWGHNKTPSDKHPKRKEKYCSYLDNAKADLVGKNAPHAQSKIHLYGHAAALSILAKRGLFKNRKIKNIQRALDKANNLDEKKANKLIKAFEKYLDKDLKKSLEEAARPIGQLSASYGTLPDDKSRYESTDFGVDRHQDNYEQVDMEIDPADEPGSALRQSMRTDNTQLSRDETPGSTVYATLTLSDADANSNYNTSAIPSPASAYGSLTLSRENSTYDREGEPFLSAGYDSVSDPERPSAENKSPYQRVPTKEETQQVIRDTKFQKLSDVVHGQDPSHQPVENPARDNEKVAPKLDLPTPKRR